MNNRESTDSEHRLEPNSWVDRFGDYLFRYANSRLRDINASEEVVQETFLNGIRYQKQYSGQGPEQAWLLGILKRKIVDYVRTRNKHDRVSPYEDNHDPTNQLFDDKGNWRRAEVPWSNRPEKNLEATELWQLVQQCMAHLPSGQADVFMLSVMEGMSSDEICNELSITPANLWVRMHRARLGLAKCVGSQWFHFDELRSNKANHAQR